MIYPYAFTFLDAMYLKKCSETFRVDYRISGLSYFMEVTMDV